MNLPKKITIWEVGPRDGLQNEKIHLTLEQKAELIQLAVDAGLKNVEVGSFVSPKAIPTMADTDQLCALLPKVEDAKYRGLIFNLKGLKRAEAAGLKACELTISASRGHCLANMNKTPEDAVQSFKEVIEYANANGIYLNGAVATVFGCSIDGKVPFEQVASVLNALHALGMRDLTLADTTGMANPKQVYEYSCRVQELFPDIKWTLHFHNTRGLGLANVLAGMQAGITSFDTAYAGLGGCPFAPGASGNIATEDLVNMCNEMGIETGVDLDKCIKLGYRVEEIIGGTRSSSILRAGKCSDIIRKH